MCSCKDAAGILPGSAVFYPQPSARREAMRKLDYTKMGMRIRQTRKAKGWTQHMLAKEAGISMSFLGHIERGSRIMSLDTFAGICCALGASADELLWGVARPSDFFKHLWGTMGSNDGNDGSLGAQTGTADTDSYAMYVKIMKSVAEIMNEV